VIDGAGIFDAQRPCHGPLLHSGREERLPWKNLAVGCTGISKDKNFWQLKSPHVVTPRPFTSGGDSIFYRADGGCYAIFTSD
jgi:hypothetical protein